ncbi:MAG: phospho-sugar mutase [Verrucomicrobiota bacterium]
MPADLKPISAIIERAIASAQLMKPAADNIRALLSGNPSPLYIASITELAEAGEWKELNDRFYKTLAFGTGGLRGRTIGKIVTTAERGRAAKTDCPEFPCVGTNAMNFYNVSRATQGLVAYLHDFLGSIGSPSPKVRPKIVIAHDTRFFSREFANLAANVASANGCDAFVFDGPRSTPELSFAVRHLNASAGIVITASHNPPHDNGYKVYFGDGGQVIEPHASAIIAKVNATKSETVPPLPDDRRGKIVTAGSDIDEAYMQRLATLVLDANVIHQPKSLRIVFTPLHGTGGVILKPMFARVGLSFEVVEEQDHFDGRFPTVKSPNPENAEALRMGIELAKRTNADLVIATDPDCDRIGVAVRTASGEMKLLTGNQIGALIAWYRAKTLFDQGVLHKENASRAVIIKTFVTTNLLKAIAEYYGLRCVETLTGFKYIGAKLDKYERALPADLKRRYRELPEIETRDARLQYSSFYVFGGEESYGFSGADFAHDKDGNGAAIMFCEVAAYARSMASTVEQLLDEIFSMFGYFEEKNGSLIFEGAEGATKIARLVESYAKQPPPELAGVKVAQVTNFETQTIRDVEGDEIPKEKMSIFELTDHTRIAVRASGTEPKIKYYLFAERRPQQAKFDSAPLQQVKTETRLWLDKLWESLQADAHKRLI